jgi:hypothetical protein
MTISSVKTGAVGLSLALDNNYMEPIATTLVGSGGTNTVTFNDIPQTYKHLQLRIIARTDRGAEQDSLQLQFNSDTTNGNYYASHYISGNGASVTFDAQGTNAYVWLPRYAADSATASNFGVTVTDILDYTSTNKHKVIRNLGGYDNNGTGQVWLSSGMWFPSNITAITSIKFSPVSGTNIKQYSRFSLYGIKG